MLSPLLSPPPSLQAMPLLQATVPIDLTTFGLVLFALTMLCFMLTGCVNPGVPTMPELPADTKDVAGRVPESAEEANAAGLLPHPGDEYSLSRDSNRYVRGFDHFCEFVGNDIGGRNMGCFVGFLVSLALLASLLLLACVAATAVMWPPNPNPNPNQPLTLTLT